MRQLRFRALAKLRNERGLVIPLLLMWGIALTAFFFMMIFVTVFHAMQDVQYTVDELQHTANYTAASLNGNVSTSQITPAAISQEASTILQAGAILMNRPQGANGWGPSTSSFYGGDVPSVDLNSVSVIQPGQNVPGTLSGVAKVQGIAFTVTIHVTLWNGLANSTITKTIWAFPGSTN